MLTLDDLLIYGDWLEENDINNTVYKLFLNNLRITFIRSKDSLFGLTESDCCDYIHQSGNGRSSKNGIGDGNFYGFHNGDGQTCGETVGFVYGWADGNGESS